MKLFKTALAGLIAVTGVTLVAPTEAEARDGHHWRKSDRRIRYSSYRHRRVYRPVRHYRSHRYSYVRPVRYYRPRSRVIVYNAPSYYGYYDPVYYGSGYSTSYYAPGYYGSYYGPRYYGGTGISIAFGGDRYRSHYHRGHRHGHRLFGW